MENSKEIDNEFGKIISKLVSVIAFLLVVIAGLLITLYNFLPKYIPEAEVQISTPDKFGNFTDAGKKLALELAKDTIDYWQAPKIDELQSNTEKN